jgi:cytochrome b subunit of formate dehydrogenase
VQTYGVWILGGAIALLCAIVLVRGRIRIERGWAGRCGASTGSMASGEVDANWARQHHSLWAEREIGKSEDRAPGVAAPVVPLP